MGKKDDLINYRSFPKEDELYEKDKKKPQSSLNTFIITPLMPFGMLKHYLGEHKKAYCTALPGAYWNRWFYMVFS
jgi:hypothetical protein